MKSMLIGGQWRSSGSSVANINPSDISDTIDSFAEGGAAEVGAAVTAAHDAFPAWAASSPQVRSDILAAAAHEMMQRREELGYLLSREEGKILSEGIAEAERAARIFAFFAAETLRIPGEKLASVRPDVEVEVTREPVGVVGVITPWNFPLAIPAWKVAPALCYGNTVVMKPAELVPACAWELADILKRAGIPDGVFNLVMGSGSVVGPALTGNPKVAAVSFTGSQATGKRVAEACLANNTKLQLEMGGKNPLVILDDADLPTAVECAINGAFFSTGQRCTASSRLIVSENIYNPFIEACVERMRSLEVGHALHASTNIGPVVDENQLNNIERYLQIARTEGGSIRAGGERLRRDTDGFFLEPALITDTEVGMTINKEEVFGPVASVIRVKSYDEALHVANDTEFGLSSGICTSSLKYASDFRKKSQAGMVMVNLPTAGVDYHVPFGGTKGSSFGQREQGRYAVEFFTQVKTSYLSY